MYTDAELALLRAANPNMIFAGIDTQVGAYYSLAALSSQTVTTTNTSSGIFYDASHNRVLVTKAGAILSGYNFTNTTLVIMANNVTVQNCTFNAGPNQYYCVQGVDGTTGTTVANCTFNGGSATKLLPLEAFIQGSGFTISSNKFLNSPGDAIHIRSGTIQNNFFSGAGYSSTGSHPDAIWVSGNDGPVTIKGNFIDFTSSGSSVTSGATNSALRITTETGNTSNVTVTNNVLLGGTYTVDPGYGGNGTLSNINISNNVIGFGTYGAFYPGPPLPGVTMSNNSVTDLNSAQNSVSAWNSYIAGGLQTAQLVVSNAAANISAPIGVSSTLYGNGTCEHLFGSQSNLTLFVGGAGVQYLHGGWGASIFKYLAFSDSTNNAPDLIGGFDVAKDVIDLSRINANPGAALTNFTFIGSAAFSSAGCQVRVVQDVSSNMTLVQATMAGDPQPDMTIRLGGLLNLTAANFALTSAQSLADLSAAAGIKVAVTAGAGGAKEVTYTNVAGKSYASYESIYGNTTGISAQAFNLTNGTEQVNLMAPGLRFTDGGAGETITTGTATFQLVAHSSTAINATGSTSDVFQFHAGFGTDTLTGFNASDTLQFDTSMFTFLSSGMTQAQNLAALLSHSTATSVGLAIRDSAGDQLTLQGVSAAQLGASPASVKFL